MQNGRKELRDYLFRWTLRRSKNNVPNFGKLKKKITLHKHVSNLGLKFDVAMKSLSVRDLKSISSLEKLWNQERDKSGKITDDNIVEVYCKIRSYPNAGERIHKNHFLNDLGIELNWYDVNWWFIYLHELSRREEIISLTLKNGTHLSLRTYRYRDLRDRTHQGHHWSWDLVFGLSSHCMGNRIMEIEG